jgi:hypothetical protein
MNLPHKWTRTNSDSLADTAATAYNSPNILWHAMELDAPQIVVINNAVTAFDKT